ncbi:MAG TPA: TIR domain-containing protein [Longimicrobium sp.]|nr:TIR domain-containing protein [Longimicrobium sp.]
MDMEFSFDVFLSHNAQDKVRVQRLAKKLQAAGLRVWFDEWSIQPGDDIYLAVERGLEAARTLVLCLSPAALGSNWVALERSTVLFRDPVNAERRFIPLLLDDCDLPDTLRRYRYVDYRKESRAAFKELLAVCRPAETAAPSTRQLRARTKSRPAAKQTSPEQFAVIERRLTGHTEFVVSLAVSRDGSLVVSGSWDGTIRIWDVETGECRAVLDGHTDDVNSVVLTTDDTAVISVSDDRTIRKWDLRTGKELEVWEEEGQPMLAMALTPDGERIVASVGSKLKVWDLHSRRSTATLEGHTEGIWTVAVLPNGRQAVSGSMDATLRLWALDTGDCIASFEGHADAVRSVTVTLDGRHAVSGSNDHTIKIWDLETGTNVGTLEGHTSTVRSVAISPDGNVIASTGFIDQTVRLWDWKSGQCIGVVKLEPKDYLAPMCVAFSPGGERLFVGTAQPQHAVYVLRLTTGAAAAPLEQSRRYVNAKVVLVGESGVGKSGLAHRLIEDRFVPTESTHGMQVWRLDLPLQAQDDLDREALLWDLAGQEDYRLIHQLFLDETALALLLFNPQENDPFAEIGVWLKVLRAAVPKEQAREVAKLLVAARVDVGDAKVSQRKIERFLQAHGVAAYLPTSAKRGDNCSDAQNGSRPSRLKELIAEHIPWDRLPWTSTPRLLAELKNALIAITDQKNTRLLRFAELTQRLEQALPGESFGAADVRTAVKLLANQGLVLPLKFGDLVLLRPDLLNGYAAAVIRAARAHTDEIGSVREQAVLDRLIDLEGVERLEPADEELLMRAMVQTFLDKSLCIAEDTPEGRQLVFPSQYRQERPIPSHPEIFVSYTFTGEWQTIYTTLVVRLWYSREFQHRELWRNAAEFETSKGGTVGLLMERMAEGEGTISVFLDTDIPDELKVIFIEYVHRHLEKYARDVRRDRRYVCPACSRPVKDLDAVQERLRAKKDFIYCQKCDEKVPLLDHIEQRLASDPVARRVLNMDQRATQELDTQALEQILIGHMLAICGEANQIFRELTKFDYGIDGEVEFKDNDGSASGRKIYVQLKSGGSYLRTRKRDGKEVFDVKNPRHLEYWVSQPVDVYLVIRDAEGAIRWMNVTRYLQDRGDSASRQIVFEGERLDATAVWRVRDQFFRSPAIPTGAVLSPA